MDEPTDHRRWALGYALVRGCDHGIDVLMLEGMS